MGAAISTRTTTRGVSASSSDIPNSTWTSACACPRHGYGGISTTGSGDGAGWVVCGCDATKGLSRLTSPLWLRWHDWQNWQSRQLWKPWRGYWPMLAACLLAVVLLQAALWHRTVELRELRAEVARAVLSALNQSHKRSGSQLHPQPQVPTQNGVLGSVLKLGSGTSAGSSDELGAALAGVLHHGSSSGVGEGSSSNQTDGTQDWASKDPHLTRGLVLEIPISHSLLMQTVCKDPATAAAATSAPGRSFRLLSFWAWRSGRAGSPPTSVAPAAGTASRNLGFEVEETEASGLPQPQEGWTTEALHRLCATVSGAQGSVRASAGLRGGGGPGSEGGIEGSTLPLAEGGTHGPALAGSAAGGDDGRNSGDGGGGDAAHELSLLPPHPLLRSRTAPSWTRTESQARNTSDEVEQAERGRLEESTRLGSASEGRSQGVSGNQGASDSQGASGNQGAPDSPDAIRGINNSGAGRHNDDGSGGERGIPAAAQRGGAGNSGDGDHGSSGGQAGPYIFVGVFTSHNRGGRPALNRKYDYAQRRHAIRNTWLGDHLKVHAGTFRAATAVRSSSPLGGVAAQRFYSSIPTDDKAYGSGTARENATTESAGRVAGRGGVREPEKGAGAESRGEGSRSGLMVRFVAGEARGDPEAEAALSAEADATGDFLRLWGVLECYTCLPNKTRVFFATVLRLYPAVRWIVKADDDVYLIPQRLPAAADQWERIGADYIGCMTRGWVVREVGARWLEPNHLLLGNTYYLHAYGSAYVLSSEAVRRAILPSYEHLRLLANEDTSVGAWMLAHDVVHFEDMRLCAPTCHPAAVAVQRSDCAGLCAPLEDMLAMHRNDTCRTRHEVPLPYMPSYPEHVAFEKMWV